MTVEARVSTLSHRHANIEHEIEAEGHRPQPDQIILGRLKREKLRIKEELLRLTQH